MWTAHSLADSLNPNKYLSTIIGETSLSVILKEHQDLAVAVVIHGEYMTVEAVLASMNQVKDPAQLNYSLLKATKLLSLSSFAIEEIDGEEFYVILGETLSNTSIESVEKELNKLAINAFEVAKLITEQNNELGEEK